MTINHDDRDQAPGTAAGFIVRYLEARRAYRASMHPGDRALMSDVVAVQPLQAQLASPSLHKAVELTEGHLSSVLQDLAAERERVARARKALIDDGFFTPGDVGADVAPRIVELVGFLRADIAEKSEHLRTATLMLGNLVEQNVTVRFTLESVLSRFKAPQRAPGIWYFAQVAPAHIDKWRATLARLTPPATGVGRPAAVVREDQADARGHDHQHGEAHCAAGAGHPAPAPAGDEPACALCGCTESAACEGGCAWFPNRLGRDVCTTCVITLTEHLVPRITSSAALAAAEGRMLAPDRRAEGTLDDDGAPAGGP